MTHQQQWTPVGPWSWFLSNTPYQLKLKKMATRHGQDQKDTRLAWPAYAIKLDMDMDTGGSLKEFSLAKSIITRRSKWIMAELDYNTLIYKRIHKSILYLKDKTEKRVGKRRESLFIKEWQLIKLEEMTDVLKSPFYTHYGNNQFRPESSVDAKGLGMRTITCYHSISS